MAKNDMPDIVAMGGDNNYTEVEGAGMLVDLGRSGLYFKMFRKPTLRWYMM
ncbi:MAG: hypothetical protein ACLURP_15795 [Ruminococcus sp.]